MGFLYFNYMSKNRFINTKFWSDNFIVELNPLDRYLFLYFLTNEHTNIAGIYELSLRTISFETGIEKEMLEKMIKRLDGKIYYIDGWVFIKNFEKHNFARGHSKVVIGIENAKKDIPKNILDKIALLSENQIPHPYPIEGSCDSDSDSDSDSDLDREASPSTQKNSPVGIKKLTPKQLTEQFFENIDLQEKTISSLTELGLPEEFVKTEILKFISYWTERNKSGTKQRWEIEKTFEVNRRLNTWFSNSSKFSGQKKVDLSKGVRIS